MPVSQAIPASRRRLAPGTFRHHGCECCQARLSLLSARGPTWLLLHGTPLTPAVWDGVIPELAEHGKVAAPALGDGPHLQADIAARLAGQSYYADPPWLWSATRSEARSRSNLHCGNQICGYADADLHARHSLSGIRAAADAVEAGRVDIDGSLARWFGPK